MKVTKTVEAASFRPITLTIVLQSEKEVESIRQFTGWNGSLPVVAYAKDVELQGHSSMDVASVEEFLTEIGRQLDL